MCEGVEQSPLSACQNTGDAVSKKDLKLEMTDKSVLSGDKLDVSSRLLELAANDDLSGFRQEVERGAKIDGVGSWYCRKNGNSQMAFEQRTAVMIASLYGSLNVLSFILNAYNESGGDINRGCGSDESTALHCAAAGGALCAVETVKLLLSFGADPNVSDSQGRLPGDVIAVSPKLFYVKLSLERILKSKSVVHGSLPIRVPSKHVVPRTFMPSDCSRDDGLPSSEYIFESMDEFDMMVSESDNGELGTLMCSPQMISASAEASGYSSLSPSFSCSPKLPDGEVGKPFGAGSEKFRDYAVDLSLPDIKNSNYTTDEFRMFSFKVRPCSRGYSHDWTECPFVHPGENARRRDPRRYHYSCVPCPDFRKGVCRRGDACEYAHGVFECWLHPAQYRTRLCKDGTNCTRRVCFFAHTTEELRPLYVSSSSAVLSPRTPSFLDMASLSPPLPPTSPSSVLVSAFSPSNPAQSTFSTPPLSPSAMANHLGGTWQQSNVPTLQLPGVGLHSSRLRASLNARDLLIEDLTGSTEDDGQWLGEFSPLSSQALCSQALLNTPVAASVCSSTSSRLGKFRNMGIAVTPTNLEELFALEKASSSPRPSGHESALRAQFPVQNPPNQIHTQFQDLSPVQINSPVLSQASTELHLQPSITEAEMQGHSFPHSYLEAPFFSISSPGLASSHIFDADQQSCNGSRQNASQLSPFALRSLDRGSVLGFNWDLQSSNSTSGSPAVATASTAFTQRDKQSYSSRDLGGSFAWSDWGSPSGKPEWGVQKDELLKLRTSASFKSPEDPDISWVQKLVKEGPHDADSTTGACSAESSSNGNKDSVDHSVLRLWIEQMQLDQIVA